MSLQKGWAPDKFPWRSSREGRDKERSGERDRGKSPKNKKKPNKDQRFEREPKEIPRTKSFVRKEHYKREEMNTEGGGRGSET